MAKFDVIVRIWVEMGGLTLPEKRSFGPGTLHGAVHAALLVAGTRPIESWSIEGDGRLVSGRGRQALEVAASTF